jgi:integrase/recombinase XerD
LPDIVTVEETERIFLATQVLSYRVFFFTLYSLGLRLGEGLRLTVADIDGARGHVHIRDAKGNKDRLVPATDGYSPTSAPFLAAPPQSRSAVFYL